MFPLNQQIPWPIQWLSRFDQKLSTRFVNMLVQARRKVLRRKQDMRRTCVKAKLSCLFRTADLDRIPTPNGKGLLVGGWWGICRRPNYLGDLIMWWTFAVMCGEHEVVFLAVVHVPIVLSPTTPREMKVSVRRTNPQDPVHCCFSRF